MKTKLYYLCLAACMAVIAAALDSCVQAPDAWGNTPNPLDTPAYNVVKPESMGNFGPHSEYYDN